jgi:hypothetical protein
MDHQPANSQSADWQLVISACGRLKIGGCDVAARTEHSSNAELFDHLVGAGAPIQ